MAEVVDYDYQPESGGGKFLNLKSKGDKVTIRLASKPITYFVHWLDNKPFICEGSDGCPTCQELVGLSAEDLKKKENAQKRRRQTFVWPVIDRADNEAKIFKSGIGVFLSVGEFAKDPKWGGTDKDATKFDVTIVRTETSLQNFYSVVPDPTSLGKELTKEEKSATDKLSPLIDSIVSGQVSQEVDAEVSSQSVAEVEDKGDFISGLEADSAKEKEESS